MSSRFGFATYLFSSLLLLASLALAQERQLVATLDFEIGVAELDAGHTALLDGIKAQYPPDDYMYSFEGDHDPNPFDIITPGASKRVNERLAETRWQGAAEYLGVPAIGLVRYTGKTEARVYVQRRPIQGPGVGQAQGPSGVADSLAALRRGLDDLRRWNEELEAARKRSAAPETILSVARFEELHERSDKWLDRSWWEVAGGVEIGILRVSPERPEKHTGATLAISNGTPAYHALDISTRLDLFRLGVARIGITPALRLYDWDVRVHYGTDAHAPISFINDSDPVYLIGADLDAVPWDGGLIRLAYAGFGARVHAAHRNVISYDQYNLRLDQNLWPRWRFELQGVYDERFEKSLCYYGGWIAYGWRMRMGEFAIHLGYVEQLDAFAAARYGREDPISTVSLGFSWERQRRFKY
jgi:hypothetical protein